MRKTSFVTISSEDAENRDRGKTFKLTEMDAFRTEKWGLRALLALEASGFAVPEEVRGTGMAGIAALGAERIVNPGGHMDFSLFEPLLDEMLGCIQFVPDAKNQNVVLPLRPNLDDVEEVTTLLELRREVLLLHLGFLPADARSKARMILTNPSAFFAAQTSPPPSQPPSDQSE